MPPAKPSPMALSPATELAEIQVRGAAEHNLKNVDLDLPKRRLVVFTGPSGSGKYTPRPPSLWLIWFVRPKCGSG